MNNENTVSVVVPIFNTHKKFLEELIRSIAQQKVLPDEVLFVNDHSVVNYENEFVLASTIVPNVKWIDNIVNLGMVENWNWAVENAEGQFIIVLGHDDVLERKAIAVFKEHVSKSSLLVADCKYFGENSVKPKFNHKSKIFAEKPVYSLTGSQVLKLLLKYGNAIGELSSIFFEKKTFLEVGGYRKEYKHGADKDFIARMAMKKNKLVIIKKKLIRRRMHENMLTNENFTKGIITLERELFFIEYKDAAMLEPRDISWIKANLFYHYIYDAFKGISKQRYRLVAYALGKALKYSIVPVSIHFSFLKAYLTGRSPDAQ